MPKDTMESPSLQRIFLLLPEDLPTTYGNKEKPRKNYKSRGHPKFNHNTKNHKRQSSSMNTLQHSKTCGTTISRLKIIRKLLE
ncbi:hypothetical protein EYC80_008198 [Monilinia laxa]|nr:hypothetical protein EYC80_008198 [Monilinia laxa]